MRTITTAQAAVRAAGVQADFVRVQVKDSGGTFRDLTTYPGFNAVKSVTWRESVSDPHMVADITLFREMFKLSLSPFMAGSAINRAFNPAASPEALLFLNRELKIEVAIVAADRDPESGDWMEVFRGRIDTVDPAAGVVRLECRDLAGRLAQQQIKYETVLSYAEVAGVAVPLRVWKPQMLVAVGDYLLPATRGSNDSGFNRFFVCSVGGTTGSVEPVWGTGSAIPDDSDGGPVEWDYVGAPTTAGNPVEEIIQNILTRFKAASDAAVTLYTPSSPGWAIRQFQQQRTYVYNAVRALANQIGWDTRFKWRSATSQFEFTLFEPERASPSVAYTFAASEYMEPTKCRVSIANIRNAWRVIYSDRSDLLPDGTPKRKEIEVSDTPSINKYGELWAEIQEDSNSQVDTSTEATKLANAALSDCKEPDSELSIPLARGFPWVESGDFYTFAPDNLTFDSSQSRAVTGWSQTFETGKRLKTVLEVRGKPTIGTANWIGRSEHPAATQHREPHRISHFEGVDTATPVLTNEVGGVSVRLTQTPDKAQLFESDVELHISTTSGFTPSSSTLKTTVKGGAKTVSDLVPGKPHYLRTVPRHMNAGRIVRGQPSAELAFIAARASAGHSDSLVSQGHFPLNGNFEHALDDLDDFPFDHWNVTGGTWGSSGDLFHGTDAVYGNYISLRQTGGDPGLRSNAFPVRREGGHFNVYLSVRPQGTLTATRRLKVYFRFYRKSDLSDSPVTFTHSVPHNVAAANVWASHIINSETIGAIPFDINFCTIAFGKEDISSAYGWDVGDIFFCEAQQQDLWATRRLFAAAVYGSSSSVPTSIFQESIIAVGSGGSAPAFGTNWGNTGAGYQATGFFKDAQGRVHLRGQPKVTTGTLTATIFTLPAGYIPSAIEQYVVRMGTGVMSYVEIDTGGAVKYQGGVLADAQAALSLASISFDPR